MGSRVPEASNSRQLALLRWHGGKDHTVSLQAIVWVIEEADVDKNLFPVLMSLANHADRSGREAYPSVNTICWEARKSRAQVKKDLGTLREQGLIKYNTEVTLSHIPADRRPAVYDLVLTKRRNMTACPVERPASGWPSEHPARRDDRGLADDTPIEKPQVSEESAPGARPRATAHPEPDRGLIEGLTGGSPTSPKPSLEPSNNPHTPAAASASTEDLLVQAGVGVDPEDEQPLIDVLVRNVVKRTSVSKQKHDDDAKKEIMAKARQCIAANVTIEEIDNALSSVIDATTTHPINKGIKVLDTLLKRTQGAADPFGGATAAGAAAGTTAAPTPPSWIDSDGEEWPQKRIHERECQGRSCHDVSGKRYVSINQPGLGAFSCPICRIAYKKQGSAIA